MPFTISHVVAVLPLTTGRAGRVLVPGALVIGSMVPDLPYFIPAHVGAEWSHSALGPVTVDLGWGVALYALWHFVLVRPLRDLGPGWLRARLPHQRQQTPKGWLSVAGSVVVGGTTHVLWDTFTHPHRWGTRHVAWLSSDVGGLPWFKWFQYASGVVGLIVLASWVAAHLFRSAADQETTGLVRDRTRAACSAVTAVVATGSVAVTWLLGGLRTGSWFDEVLAVRVATRTISLTATAVLVLCLLWQLWRRVARSPGDA
jgi:hypothetical protein